MRYLHVDRVLLAELVAVSEQGGGVVHQPAEIETLQLKPLRTRVGEERSDRVVQPLGLA